MLSSSPAALSCEIGADILGDDAEGWVEKDGIAGYSSLGEQVHVDDTIQNGVILHVGCNNCTCTDAGLICTQESCARDCEWSAWSPWTDCSETCGTGLTERTRTISRPALNGGASCDGETSEETKFCNLGDCHEWSTWSAWSNCTAQCGGGVRERRRECSNSVPTLGGDSPCEGSPLEQELCSSKPCGEKCTEENTEWVEDCSSRDSCPLTCGHLANTDACVESETCEPGCYCKEGLIRDDSGKCIKPAQCSCQDGDNLYLAGATITSVDGCTECTCTMGKLECEDKECNVDCGYTEWTAWSECTRTCGGGVKRRTRLGENPAAKGTGSGCSEAVEEEAQCHTEPCPLCEDPVTGQTYSVGETVEDTLCYTVYCSESLELVNKTKDEPACAVTPTPNGSCSLAVRTETISIRNSNGTLCVSKEPVPITVCQGGCNSYDTGAITFADEDEAGVGIHRTSCRCCSGTGRVKDVDVYCGEERRTVRVMEYTECGCNACEEGKESTTSKDSTSSTNDQSPVCTPQLDYASYVSGDFTVSSTKARTEGYQAEMALKGSGSVSLLADDEDWTSDAFAFDAIDTLMNIEGVTFAVVGAQNVTVELYAEDMMTLIDSQSRNVEELGQDVGMTFEPAVTEVGRVKVTVHRCDLCQSVQLKEVTMFQDCDKQH